MYTVNHRNLDQPQKIAQIWSPLFPPRFKGMYDHDSRFVKCTAHGTSAQVSPEASDYAYYSTARQLRSPFEGSLSASGEAGQWLAGCLTVLAGRPLQFTLRRVNTQ